MEIRRIIPSIVSVSSDRTKIPQLDEETQKQIEKLRKYMDEDIDE